MMRANSSVENDRILHNDLPHSNNVCNYSSLLFLIPHCLRQFANGLSVDGGVMRPRGRITPPSTLKPSEPPAVARNLE